MKRFSAGEVIELTEDGLAESIGWPSCAVIVGVFSGLGVYLARDACDPPDGPTIQIPFSVADRYYRRER